MIEVAPDRREEYRRAMESIDGRIAWEAKMLAIRAMGEGMFKAGEAAWLGVVVEAIGADVKRALRASPKVPWDGGTSLFGNVR